MQYLQSLANCSWNDLAEPQPENTLTEVEKLGYENPEAELLDADQKQWCQEGFVIKPGFFSPEELEPYIAERAKLPVDREQRHNFYGGWAFPTPYMICEELKELATNNKLNNLLSRLLGNEAGVHLCLTGWVSTERNFHQDTYLNPPYLWSNYLAVWIALEDIHPDSGPFQYVPGSHRWDVLRRELLFQHLTTDQKASAHWPTFTQDQVARVCEEEIAKREAEVIEFVPKKGDILVWHSNLVHRGSEPKNKSLLRKALICHYSAVNKRLDMPVRKRHPKTNGVFFDLPTDGSVRP